MENSLLCSTFVAAITVFALVTGQCANYQLQKNQYRRSSGYQLTQSDVAISDNFLSEGWYRFESGAGNDMVTHAPPISMCGTLYPVWLNGSLPLDNEGIVNRTACVVGLQGPCESTISIRIANCSSYNVYYLRKTPSLASGYCIGKEVKCPDGQGSENGFTPGCVTLPQLTVFPAVNAGLVEEVADIPFFNYTRKSYFECEFNQSNAYPYYFDIIWYINGNEVRRTTNVRYADLSTTRLLPEHWVHQYNLNMVVKCSVRVRTSSGGIPSNEMSSSNYQAGIFPESHIYHISEGQTITIPFRVTYPVDCVATALESSCLTAIYILTPYYQPTVDTCQTIQSTEAVLFNENSCGIVISSKTWRETKFLNVTGNIDNFINERDREIYIRLGKKGRGGDSSRAWDNVTIPDIQVYISDVDNTISNRICKLQTDPRFWTFDGKRHDIYSAGEFVLYRHKKRNVAVHGLFTACSGDSGLLGAACTCGVAIRVEDSLFVYRTCGLVSYQSVNILDHHSTITEVCDDKHMVISTDSSGYTVITLPSGTIVKYVVYSSWIQHLHIVPSVFDIGNLEGICGNANGDQNDDILAPDGTRPASNNRQDIDIIINSWRIDPISPNSLFSADPALENSGDDVQKYCSCATEASNGDTHLQELPDHHAAVCNITSSLVDCSQQQTPSLFLTTCNRVGHDGRKRRALSEDGLNTRSKRVRRSTIDSDDVVDFSPISYDPAFNTSFIPPIPTWRNGWNESYAERICEDTINNDPVKLECEKHIDIQQMINDSISSCILDIRDSASKEWLVGTLDAIKSYCLTSISKYEKFYPSNSSEEEKSVLEIFNAVTCINNCSSHGKCTEKGTCSCDTGFIGLDCSQPVSNPPENSVLPEEGLCRLSIRPCAKTNIVGHFLSGTTIYVKLKQYKISMIGKGPVIKTEKTTAEYRAPNLISIALPSSTNKKQRRSVSSEYGLGFDISFSYDDTNFGDDLMFIVYNDRCFNCNSTTTTCTMLESCLNSVTESTTMSQTTTATTQGETSPTLLTSEQGTFQTESTTLTSSNTQTIQTSPTTEILLTEAPPKQHELFNNFDVTKMMLIILSAILAIALIIVTLILFWKCQNKSNGKGNQLYYNPDLAINGRPPKNTYEHIYDRPMSPSTYFGDPRKVDRPSSSSGIRAAFDDHIKSDHNVNVGIFSVARK